MFFVVFWFITNECLLQGRSICRSVGSAFGFDDLPPPPPPRLRVDEYPGDASVDMCFDCASPDARPRGGALGIRIRKLLLMCECVCMCVCPRMWMWMCVVLFLFKSMMLVDWVATKSTDSSGEWGRTSVRHRSGQKIA